MSGWVDVRREMIIKHNDVVVNRYEGHMIKAGIDKVVIGDAELYRADCRDILPTLGNVDCVILSPPYNLKKRWWECGANGIHKVLAKKFLNEWYEDEVPEDEYQQEQRELLEALRKVSRGAICYNHKVRHAIKREGRSFHPIEWTGAADLWCEIIWDRGPGPAINCRRPVMADERIFVFGRPLAWHNMGFSSIWRMRPNSKETGHPCAFPLELPLRLIQSFTDPEMIVLDTHMGSGTTGVACAKLDRKFIGIEIEEKYFKIACERIKREYDQLKMF